MASHLAIHLFMVDDPVILATFHNCGKICPEKIAVGKIPVRRWDNPKKTVDMILQFAKGYEIKVLRFVAHGNSGVVEFPGLENENLIADAWSTLFRNRVFAANARIEFHVCGLASETSILRHGTAMNNAQNHNTIPGEFTGKSTGAGLRYLRKAARIFGVMVCAAKDFQGVGYNSWKFEGSTISVFPNGKFIMDSEETREWDIDAQDGAANKRLQFIRDTYIKRNRLAEARVLLRELVKNYPSTRTAKFALERLSDPQLRDANELRGDPNGGLGLTL